MRVLNESFEHNNFLAMFKICACVFEISVC
ncbi:hypothetical protein ES703_62324 [subsurface metagenome]